MKKIKIMIADDHPAFQEGLAYLLGKKADMKVIAKPCDGEEAVDCAKELLPDVAIISVTLKKITGIEAARQIKSAVPNLPILMISAFDYESYLFSAMRVNASGYILKNAPISQFISAVRSVHKGDVVFDVKAVNKVLARFSADKGEYKDSRGLMKRELDMLKMVAKGQSNKYIADGLKISQRTVQTHLYNIFKKLESCSRTEAVLHALREGILNLDDLP